jgi:hypothetical protein
LNARQRRKTSSLLSSTTRIGSFLVMRNNFDVV